MTAIMIVPSLFCDDMPLVHRLKIEQEYHVITDQQILQDASRRCGLSGEVILRSLTSPKNRPLHLMRTYHKALESVRKSLICYYGGSEKILFHGILGHLLSACIPAILSIRITADRQNRILSGIKALGVSEKEAEARLDSADSQLCGLVYGILEKEAQEKCLYDIIFPVDQFESDYAFSLIEEACRNIGPVQPPEKKQWVENMELYSDIDLLLGTLPGQMKLSVNEGVLTICLKSTMFTPIIKRVIQTRLKEIPRLEKVAFTSKTECPSGVFSYRASVNLPVSVLLRKLQKQQSLYLSSRIRKSNTSVDRFPGLRAYKALSEMVDGENVIILDQNIPGLDIESMVDKIRQEKPDTRLVILPVMRGDEKLSSDRIL